VILVDVNLLVFATSVESPEHGRALSWLEQRLRGPTRVGLPWFTLLG